MTSLPTNGMVHLTSKYSAKDTVEKLKSAIRGKGMTIFTVIDHSGEAVEVGLKMHFAQVILFGSPKGGTPLMVAAPTVAIDLPLKALVWEDADGRVWVTYNAPEYLQQRHNVPPDLISNIAGAGTLLQKAVE
jgi:uncharacterized protein (DUF302 family)